MAYKPGEEIVLIVVGVDKRRIDVERDAAEHDLDKGVHQYHALRSARLVKVQQDSEQRAHGHLRQGVVPQRHPLDAPVCQRKRSTEK